MQYFRGDEVEHQIVDGFNFLFDALDLSIDELENKSYQALPLGEVLYDNKIVPLVNAIQREVFLNCYKEIFDSWSVSGTFESYILVFKKIFGAETVIEFTIPNPGHLQINIEAEDTTSYLAAYREIVLGKYVTGEIVDHEGNNILFRSFAGIQTQYELEQVLYFLTNPGVFTEISLTIGG